MTTHRMACAVAIAAVLAGCSSADGQSLPTQPGALRARSATGAADLGFAYAVEPVWQFATPGGLGTASLQMVLLKEQPAGAASPVLVWRALLSGAALECSRYYASTDCTGAAFIAPGQSGSVCVSGGRMYRPNFAAAPPSMTAASAAFPRWDPPTLSFVTECLPAGVPPFMLNAVDAGPAAPSPGRIYIEPAD